MKLTPDTTTPTGRTWAKLIADAKARDEIKAKFTPSLPKRAKRFTGITSQWKKWVRREAAKPGKFFTTPRQPNWLNDSRHWTKRKPIKDSQKQVACGETLVMLCDTRQPFPMLVTLTRYGPKLMDRDGNIAALKYYQDGVAAALGVDDGDRSRIDWSYEQEQTLKPGWYGVRVAVGAGVGTTGVRA